MANTEANITQIGIDLSLNTKDLINENFENLKSKDVQNYSELQQIQQTADTNLQNQINEGNTALTNHKNSTDHPAKKITFDRAGTSMASTNVEDAIKENHNRVGNILNSPIDGTVAAQMVTDMKNSAVKGKVFNTPTDRLEELEADVEDTKEPKYSTPQEQTASIFSIPADSAIGPFNVLNLQGRTLYNYVNNGTDYANWSTDAGSTKGATGIHLVAAAGNEFAKVATNLKESTVYTLIYNVKASNATGVLSLNANYTGTNITLTKNIGINKVVFTTQQTISTNELRYFLSGGIDGEYVDFELYAILEGDYTADAGVNKPFKFGANSTIGDLRVKCRNDKGNLWDGTYVAGSLDAAGNFVSSASGYRSTNLIPCKPNQAYTISGGDRSSVRFLDSSGNVVQNTVSTTVPRTVTSPSTAYKMQWYYSTNGTHTELMINEGTTALPYAIQEASIVYISLQDYLRSLPTVKDVISVVDGTYTKKTKDVGSTVKVATDWIVVDDGSTNTIRFRKGGLLPDIIPYTTTQAANAILVIGGITFTPIQVTSIIAQDTECFSVSATNELHIKINKSRLATSDNTGFEAWLQAQSSASLIYQLAAPVTTEIPGLNNLQAGPGYTIIVDPAIQDHEFYNGGIAIRNTALPIQEIESVVKVEIIDEKTEVLTPIVSSNIVIAGDKLSFTITGATTGEKYRYVYKYPPELTTLPTISYSYPLNIAAGYEQVLAVQKQLQKELGSVWITLLPLADKELKMYMISSIATPATVTTEELANKVNEILTVWR
ncbi:hypothetical protein [Petroclostridium sp. X23]|uniref:hypothetical protein n=1 Tax=Petroclostridium sp. X23 TaxID=3045146 RepID=UPI0024ADF208|nr:hypothetical protein [Petroclostridium sp. X23]WHH59172.1 hypothetical protein QKW49_25860 [Petroclostridium sp. X23]